MTADLAPRYAVDFSPAWRVVGAESRSGRVKGQWLVILDKRGCSIAPIDVTVWDEHGRYGESYSNNDLLTADRNSDGLLKIQHSEKKGKNGHLVREVADELTPMFHAIADAARDAAINEGWSPPYE